MPRFAIKQARALHTIYRDADDVVDAINLARRALVDHAKHGELDVYRVPDNPDAYDQARDDQQHFRQGADRDDEVAVRWGLERRQTDSEEVEPW